MTTAAPPAARRPEAPLAVLSDGRLLAHLWPFMRPERARLVLALLLIPLTTLLSLVQPLLLKEGIDAMVLQQSRARLLQVLLFFIAVVTVEFVLRFIQTYALQLAGQRAVATLRLATFRHLQRLRVSYFDHRPVGRTVTRVTSDVDNLAELFSSGAVLAIADLLTLGGVVAFMLYLDWQLSLIAFSLLPVLALLADRFRRVARHAFRTIRAKLAELNGYLAEQVAGLAVVQSFRQEMRCAAEYGRINNAYRHATHKAIRYDALLFSVVDSVAAACIAVVLYFAARRLQLLDAATAAAYVGTVVAFYDYIQRFFVPVRDLSQKYAILQSSLAAAERIAEVLAADDFDAPPAHPATSGDRSAVTAAGGGQGDAAAAAVIRFDAVDFAYRPAQPTLQQLSWHLDRCEKVAFVGPTGSGKSTILSLILRLFPSDAGVITVQGRPIEVWPPADLRRQFSFLAQTPWVFRGTVLDNLRLDHPNEDRDRAAAALEAVDLARRLHARGGLDLHIEEEGRNLSAGERQLLAFARALYHDRHCLLMDEATAQLDRESEAMIERATEQLLAGRSAIIVAHRLATIEDCDRIHYLDGGRIRESGSHAELMAKRGPYHRLVHATAIR
ncbi:MAG: ABC transporter ATP-binding protein [Polyangiales bacterium]